MLAAPEELAVDDERRHSEHPGGFGVRLDAQELRPSFAVDERVETGVGL